MNYNYENLPRYQRLKLKLASYTPDQMAIVDSLLADKQFGNEQIRTELAGMRLASQKKAGEQSVKRAKHSLKMGDYASDRLKMRENAQDWTKKQNRLGTYLGAANVLGSAGLGVARYNVLSDLAKKEAANRKDLSKLWPHFLK